MSGSANITSGQGAVTQKLFCRFDSGLHLTIVVCVCNDDILSKTYELVYVTADRGLSDGRIGTLDNVIKSLHGIGQSSYQRDYLYLCNITQNSRA